MNSTEHCSSRVQSLQTQSRLFPDDPPLWKPHNLRKTPGCGRWAAQRDCGLKGQVPWALWEDSTPGGPVAGPASTLIDKGDRSPSGDIHAWHPQTRVPPRPVPTRPSTPTPHLGAAHSPLLGFLESLLWLPRPLQITARETVRQSRCHQRLKIWSEGGLLRRYGTSPQPTLPSGALDWTVWEATPHAWVTTGQEVGCLLNQPLLAGGVLTRQRIFALKRNFLAESCLSTRLRLVLSELRGTGKHRLNFQMNQVRTAHEDGLYRATLK